MSTSPLVLKQYCRQYCFRTSGEGDISWQYRFRTSAEVDISWQYCFRTSGEVDISRQYCFNIAGLCLLHHLTWNNIVHLSPSPLVLKQYCWLMSPSSLVLKQYCQLMSSSPLVLKQYCWLMSPFRTSGEGDKWTILFQDKWSRHITINVETFIVKPISIRLKNNLICNSLSNNWLPYHYIIL
jgi:hypothetical protein